MKRQHQIQAIRALAECVKLCKSRDEALTYMGLIELLKKLISQEQSENY